MKKRLTWDHITKEATTDDRMNTRDLLSFHYFNPNGVYAAKRSNDDAISALVDAGTLRSGWLIAHGLFDRFHPDKLSHMLRLKRPARRDVIYHIEAMRRRNIEVKMKLDAVYMGIYFQTTTGESK